MDLNWSDDHSSPPAAVVLVSMSSTTSSTSSIASAHSKSSSPFLAFWLNNCAASNLALNWAASSADRSLAANFSTYASPSEKSDTNQTNAFSALGMGLRTHWGCWATTWKEKKQISCLIHYCYHSNFSARGVIYLPTKLATGLRVFSCLITNWMDLSSRFRMSLAFPIPRSFHCSSRHRKSLVLIFIRHSRFSSPEATAYTGILTYWKTK